MHTGLSTGTGTEHADKLQYGTVLFSAKKYKHTSKKILNQWQCLQMIRTFD
jgi:hypothetical protein